MSIIITILFPMLSRYDFPTIDDQLINRPLELKPGFVLGLSLGCQRHFSGWFHDAWEEMITDNVRNSCFEFPQIFLPDMSVCEDHRNKYGNNYGDCWAKCIVILFQNGFNILIDFFCFRLA